MPDRLHFDETSDVDPRPHVPQVLRLAQRPRGANVVPLRIRDVESEQLLLEQVLALIAITGLLEDLVVFCFKVDLRERRSEEPVMSMTGRDEATSEQQRAPWSRRPFRSS
jgi:hypothetical protein